jgi:hypothetical protein
MNMKLPITPYSAGCLAMSATKLWCDTDVGERKSILEIELSTGKVLREMYRPSPENNILMGLLYISGAPDSELLFFTYGRDYEGWPVDPSTGQWYLKSQTVKRNDPEDGIPASRRRGALLVKPYHVALGFGGYEHRAEDMNVSWGPCLWYEGKYVVGPYVGNSRAPRAGNYTVDEDSWVGWKSKNRWTACDVISGPMRAGGAVIVRDEVWFFATLGIGKIRYEPGGLKCDGYAHYIYKYSWPGGVFKEAVRHKHGDIRGVAKSKGKVYGISMPSCELVEIT